ncbi:hypothetical protein SAY87_028532 [Trapa incisa]|uniref:Uncharacterized protein n=1 Tax=Trapa incisa TaxID=236973 RepID=A0AAN7KZZ1_9MYRT|nr:hypothetical protein SAY87_028532 [Trapa incisa]
MYMDGNCLAKVVSSRCMDWLSYMFSDQRGALHESLCSLHQHWYYWADPCPIFGACLLCGILNLMQICCHFIVSSQPSVIREDTVEPTRQNLTALFHLSLSYMRTL